MGKLICLSVLAFLLAATPRLSTRVLGSTTVSTENPPGFVLKWGSLGSSQGQFYYPMGIGFGPAGNVYVSDSNNHRIQKFTSNGTFITKWGGPGT
jgi:DNA-binding beta-propeller fold protein YncE